MTVPWASGDDECHYTADQESPPSISSAPFEHTEESEFISTVELCFIKLDSEFDQPSHSYKPVLVVNDVFFNLHSRTVIVHEAGGLTGNEQNYGKGNFSARQHQKYTVFIIVVIHYEPEKLRYVNNNCQLKVKTNGKHRKLMLKSSFIALEDVGQLGDYLVNSECGNSA